MADFAVRTVGLVWKVVIIPTRNVGFPPVLGRGLFSVALLRCLSQESDSRIIPSWSTLPHQERAS